MSDAPKFKTFRDLRSIPKSSEKDQNTSTSISSSASTSSISSTPSNTSITRTSRTTNTQKKSQKLPHATTASEIAPVRDFQKVPNSVTRAALPQGIFRGKSKQVWDYLWSVSRGAINPARTVRKSRKEIKKGSGLGSMVTVDAAIEHLIQIGLLKVNRSVGSLNGNEYEIFTPEETDSSTSISSISSISSNTSPIQNLVELDIPESGNTRRSQNIENKTGYGDANTSFKTNTNDDDTLTLFFQNFDKASRELTGKGINPNERERWGRLADILILELHAAARHTQISSVPAFLTEHLRRKLLNVPAAAPKTTKAKKDTVGNTDSGDYEIKPLDGKGREAALEQLREFAGEDFLQDFKKWYTDEDWQWLIKELKMFTKGNV